MFEDFKNKDEKKILMKVLGELFDQLPEPKETDPIEDQFQYHLIKFSRVLESIQENQITHTLDACKMDILLPIMKDFTAKANEILGERK